VRKASVHAQFDRTPQTICLQLLVCPLSSRMKLAARPSAVIFPRPLSTCSVATPAPHGRASPSPSHIHLHGLPPSLTGSQDRIFFSFRSSTVCDCYSIRRSWTLALQPHFRYQSLLQITSSALNRKDERQARCLPDNIRSIIIAPIPYLVPRGSFRLEREHP
jgi:hypothetical protein